MKLFLDLKNRRFVKSAASNVALDRIVLKRRDTLPIEVVYVENGAVATPPAGTTAAVGLKAKFSDSNFLAFAAPGQTTLDLNTLPVEAAFSSNPATVSALLEIKWGAPGTAHRTATLAVELQNAVITGTEGTPQAIPDGKATQAEAEAGTDNAKWMTPLRTAQAIDALATSAHFGPNPPPAGSNDLLWVDTDTGRQYALIGTKWIETGSSGSGGGGGVTSYNDLTDKPTLGTAAATNATAYATAAQGAKADSASQPGHTHSIADTTGLSSSLAAKITGSGVADMQVVPALPASPSPTTFYIVIPTGATTASAVTLGSVSLLTSSGGGGGSTFTPTSISGLQLWLDASDEATFFDSTSGGASVTSDGAAVARWQDKSSNAYEAIQATANQRPILKQSVQNSKSILRFDGANDCLQIPSIELNTNITMFVVGKFFSTNPLWLEHDYGFYLSGNSLGWLFRRLASVQAGGLPENWFAVSAAISSITYNGTAAQVRKNGTLLANSAISGTAPTNILYSAPLNIGSRGQTQLFSKGDLCELLIYDGVLTEQNTAQVETYLGTKWGISL